MTRKEALAELIAKVEAGDIAKAPFWKVWVPEGQDGNLAYTAKQAASGSLDAAKLLHEAMLPGWGWRVGGCHLSDDAFVFPDFNCPTHGERLRATVPELINGQEWSEYTDIDQRPAGCAARAWLLSILNALHSMETNA